MIKAITVTNYIGNRMRLELGSPQNTGIIIKSINGLGAADADINTTDIITRDGGLFNSSRIKQRNIVFNLLFMRSVLGETIEDIRQKTYKYFPVKREVELVIETDNRNVKIAGYVESNEPNIFSEREGTQISIICPDPYFYEAKNGDYTVTEFYSVEPMFEFPFSNDSMTEKLLNFGETNVNTEGVVTYFGDSEVGMIVHIHALGLATNIRMHNITTRETMLIDTAKVEEITGGPITAGDDIFINTNKGYKSITLVRNGKTYNILNSVGKNASWFTLVKGDNLFAFTAESGISHLRILIKNKTLYEGV